MVKEYELINIKIEDIKFDGDNPNIMTVEQEEALTYSMEKFGYLTPIIIDQNNIVADGEHRVKIYKAFGKTEIPAYRIEVTDAERKILRQVMNKLKGKHDKDLDAEEFKKIIDAGLKEELFKFIEDKEVSKILDSVREAEEDDFEPKPEPEFIVKHGEVWQLGRHRLMCGDATAKQDVDKLMDGKKADMVFTDPPYGVDYEQGKFTGIKVKKKFKAIENDDKKGEELRDFIRKSTTLMYNNLNEGSPLYICSPSMTESLALLYGCIDVGFHMQSQLIWKKNTFILGRADYHWQHELIWYGYKGKNHYWCGDRNQSTIWDISKDATSKYQHPTQKPVALPYKAIKNSSSENKIVLDLFGGSGSTLIAAEQLNRICYTMELDPNYCSVIIERWENLTQQKAVKISEKN